MENTYFHQLRTALWGALCFSGSVILATDTARPVAPSEIPKQLTLSDARRLAFANNWDLLAAKSDIDMATAQKIIAREFPNPALSLSSMKLNVDGHPSSTRAGNGFWERSYDNVLAVNQLFEIGGKRSSRRASAAAGYAGARGRLLDVKRLLDLAATRAYIAAVQAESDAQILRQSSQSLRQEAQIAQTRLQAGDIAKTDRNQIEIAAERFELDARSAETTATTLRVALETLLGSTHPTGDWVAVDTLETLTNAAVPADETTVPESRPDLAAAEAGLKRAQADLQLQRALRIPDPTVQLMYEHEPPDQPNTVGLGFSFPLPLWNRNKGGIRSAKASFAQADNAVRKIKAQIASEIESARLGYQNALNRWQRYRDEIRPRSEEVRKTVSFAYEKGGAALLDLLTAERNDNEIRLATAQSAADTALAAAALKAALNVAEEGSEGESATSGKAGDFKR